MYHDAFELEDDDEPIVLTKSSRHKIKIKDNIIDTKAQQSRPRGPRNKVYFN